MEPRQTYENLDAQAFKILHTKIEDEKAKKSEKMSEIRVVSGELAFMPHVETNHLLLPLIIVFYYFFRGHGNESCNLIGSKPGQYFPISAHGPR